jgi:lysophospholipase L1-like esterase
MMNKLKRHATLKSLLLFTMINLILLEVLSLAFTNLDIWQADKPSYSWSNVRSEFWRDIDPNFGLWHVPHSRYRHVKNCYDVSYVANSYGARDVERAIDAEGRRFVVLGDSFVEGIGVDRLERFTSLLERSTGVQHLNFGASGLGSLQYALLYERLASQFSHTDVMVVLYPTNDFADNSLEFGLKYLRNRYRPYFQRNDQAYDIIYFRPSLGRPDDRGPLAAIRVAHRFLYEFTAVFHVLDVAKRRITRLADTLFSPGLTAQANQGHDYWYTPTYSGFYDYSGDDFEKLILSLEMIVKQAAGRQVHVILAPGYIDLYASRSKKPSPLGNDLRAWARDRTVAIVDLLPRLHAKIGQRVKSAKQLFLPCDTHWNATGHQMVADEIVQAIGYHGAAGRREIAEGAARAGR